MNFQQRIREALKKPLYQYIISIFLIGATSLFCIPIRDSQNYHVVSFILLFVVSFLSAFLPMGPVLLASALSAVLWNFLFIPPHFTFHIDKTEDILIFALFFIIAFVNGLLTTRARNQELLAKENEKKTSVLFQLTKRLSESSGINEVILASVQEIKKYFGLNTGFVIQDGNNGIGPFDTYSYKENLTPKNYLKAEEIFNKNTQFNLNRDTSLSTDFCFIPLKGTKINTGVAVVQLQQFIPEEQKHFLEAFFVQISNAIEREFLSDIAQKARLLDESDRLYKTLFNSISHELRIPIATIMSASDTLMTVKSTEDISIPLCSEIFSASVRLNRLIENLLNMSRIESTHIVVHLDWYDINDLFNKVLDDLKEELRPFTVIVTIPSDMPFIRVDFGLIEQVLYNLLVNSTQYAPAGSVIELTSGYQQQKVNIKVRDMGPGFTENGLKEVFNKFFRENRRKTGGLGLGLSIVKGFVDAHNGTITVENASGGGALFSINIPSEVPDVGKINIEEL